MEQEFHFIAFAKIIQGLALGNSQYDEEKDRSIRQKLLNSSNSLLDSLKHGDFNQQRQYIEFLEFVFSFFASLSDCYQETVKIRAGNGSVVRIAVNDSTHWCRIVIHLLEWIGTFHSDCLNELVKDSLHDKLEMAIFNIILNIPGDVLFQENVACLLRRHFVNAHLLCAMKQRITLELYNNREHSFFQRFDGDYERICAGLLHTEDEPLVVEVVKDYSYLRTVQTASTLSPIELKAYQIINGVVLDYHDIEASLLDTLVQYPKNFNMNVQVCASNYSLEILYKYSCLFTNAKYFSDYALLKENRSWLQNTIRWRMKEENHSLDFGFAVSYLNNGPIDEFGLSLLSALLEGIEDRSFHRSLCIHHISLISHEILSGYFSIYPNILFMQVVSKFIQNERLLPVITGFLSLSVQQFIDKGLYFMFPILFFNDSPLLETLIRLKGYDNSTFYITNVHCLVGYAFFACQGRDEFDCLINRTLRLVSELSGNRITLQDILKACFQDVVKLLFIDSVRSNDLSIKAHIECSLHRISQIILNEKDSSTRALEHLLKKCYLGLFYSLQDDLKSSHCHYERCLLVKVLLEITKLVDVDDLRTYVSHIIPFLEDTTVKYEHDAEFNEILCQFWERLIPTTTHDSRLELLFFLQRCDLSLFEKCKVESCSTDEVQVLFFNNFNFSPNFMIPLLSSFLSSKYEFIVDYVLNVFYSMLTEGKKGTEILHSMEPVVVDSTLRLLFPLASNPQLCAKCMKIFALFGFNEELGINAQKFSVKPDTCFMIDYLDTRNAILEASSSIIEDFLIPTFRSCRDLSFQDRLAYVIQELLKITGYSQLIVPTKHNQPVDTLSLNGYECVLMERWKQFPAIVKDNLFPLLKAKYVVSLPEVSAKNPSHLLRLASFSVKEWIFTFFSNMILKISSDFLVEFFSPFKAIINNDTKLINYILSCVILCSTMDPVEYDMNADYIVAEFNAVFRHFSSNSNGRSNPHLCKLVELLFSIMQCLKSWMQRIIGLSFKAKRPTSNGNILALRRIEEIFFSKIDKQAAASCALLTNKPAVALMLLESCSTPVGRNNDFIASNYQSLKTIYSKLDGMSDLKELVKHYHDDNMDLRIIFEMENDWRNCLLLNQRNPNNQYEIDKCLYMLGMDEIIVQRYSSGTQDLNEYAARAIINLQKWDLVDVYKEGNNSLKTISHILNDTISLDLLLVPDDFQQTRLNAGIFHDIGRNFNELLQERLALLHFDSYDKIFGFHLLIDKFGPSNLWLERAKFCRKNRLFDLSYASLLKIPNHLASCEVVMERAKIMWHQGYRIQALQELKDNQDHIKFNYHPSTATANASSSDQLKGKILRLTAKWMDELKMDKSGEVLKKIREAIFLDEHSEKGHYMFAKYHYKLYLNHLEKSHGKDELSRFQVIASNALNIVRCFARALLTGSKFVYESMPRMLNVWLDVTGKCYAMYEKGPPDPSLAEIMTKMETSIDKLISRLAPWQFYVGINLLIARFNHACPVSSDLMQRILITLLQHYPDQTMWFLFSQARSSNPTRKGKFLSLVSKLKTTSSTLKFDQEFMTRFNQCLTFFESLLQISNYSLGEKQVSSFSLSSLRDFKYFNQRLFPLKWIIPQTDSLVPLLPTDNSCNLTHNAFPSVDSQSCITGIKDTVEVLNSLQRPKKVSLIGSDGREHEFLCKPKDDLRTDARVMEFFSLVNKLIMKDKNIKANNELNSIRIRCYCVLPLNEECGIIEWVPSTICYRTAVNNTYSIKGITLPAREELIKIFEMKMPQPEIFTQRLLPRYPSVFADWFRFQFVDAMHWYSAKQHYARSTATMSMVGAMLGLGDRHGENIMLDELTGSVVHVDFNCLFDKGLKFAKPERVPFRMTHNMENALGILGTKGFFRDACVAVLGILRNNRDMLLSNLETFVHDPIIDFAKKKPSSSAVFANNASRSPEVEEAVRCITMVGTRLMGYVGDDLPLSVEGQVEELIKNATDINNLSQMFIGWAAFL